MIWIFPISPSILSSLSIISILISSFSTGTSMIANMKSTVDHEIAKFDKGISLKPETRIRELQKINFRGELTSILRILKFTIILFLLLIFLMSMQPEMKNDIRVVFTPKRYIDVVQQESYLEYKQDFESLTLSEKGVLLTTNINSSKYNKIAVAIVISGVVLSWVLFLLIGFSFYSFLSLSFKYIDIFPAESKRNKQ